MKKVKSGPHGFFNEWGVYNVDPNKFRRETQSRQSPCRKEEIGKRKVDN